MSYYAHGSAIVEHGEKIGKASRELNGTPETIDIHNKMAQRE